MGEVINISGIAQEKVVNTQEAVRTNIIELVGPPGAGKSTVYEALVKKWTKKCSWDHQFNQVKRGRWERWLRSVSGKKGGDRIQIEKGMEFINTYPALADFVWNHIADPKTFSYGSNDKKFRAAYFNFRDFCRMQSMIARCDSAPVIVDEGLVQRSFLLNSDHQTMYENVSTYLDLIPLPAAVIVADTEKANVLFNRIKKRKKVIASHMGLDDFQLYKDLENWQLLFKMIIEKLERKKVTVFSVSAEESVEKNANLIYEFLNSQSV